MQFTGVRVYKRILVKIYTSGSITAEYFAYSIKEVRTMNIVFKELPHRISPCEQNLKSPMDVLKHIVIPNILQVKLRLFRSKL